jgi:hypothetical protein
VDRLFAAHILRHFGRTCECGSISGSPEGGPILSNNLDAIRADQQNFLDKTEDEVKEAPSSTQAGEAVEAVVAHLNKYDEPEENERD